MTRNNNDHWLRSATNGEILDAIDRMSTRVEQVDNKHTLMRHCFDAAVRSEARGNRREADEFLRRALVAEREARGLQHVLTAGFYPDGGAQ